MYVEAFHFGILPLWAIWLFLLFRSTKSRALRLHFFIALPLKVAAGFALGGVYQWYFEQGRGADTFGLFYDGVWLAQLAYQNFWQYADFFFFSDWETDQHIYQQLYIKNPRGVIFSKIVSIFALFAGSSYWAVSLCFSLLSFTGIWWFIRQIAAYRTELTPSVIGAFCYVPSVVFWSAGIMKESLLMFCLCSLAAIFIAFFLAPHKKNHHTGWWITHIGGLLPLGYLLLALKYYYFAVMFPLLWASGLALSFPRKATEIFYGSLLIAFIVASFSHPNLNLSFVLEALVRNNLIMASQTCNPENLLNFQHLTPEITSMLRNVPIALWEGWTRPYIWESGNFLKKIAAIETLGTTLLLFVALLPPYQFPKNNQDKIVLSATVIFCLLLWIMLALAAPNLGNLVRYKSAFLPFALFIIFEAIRRKPYVQQVINSVCNFLFIK